jgi:hypothetical protein
MPQAVWQEAPNNALKHSQEKPVHPHLEKLFVA